MHNLIQNQPFSKYNQICSPSADVQHEQDKVNANLKKFSRFGFSKSKEESNFNRKDVGSFEEINSSSKLKDSDKLTRSWQELAKQIKALKRKIRKMSEFIEQQELNKEVQPKSQFEQVQDSIDNSCDTFYSREQKDLLRNLILVIAEGRLKPNSYDFNKICEIIRGCMPLHIIQTLYKEKNMNIMTQPNFMILGDFPISFIQLTSNNQSQSNCEVGQQIGCSRHSNFHNLNQKFCCCEHINSNFNCDLAINENCRGIMSNDDLYIVGCDKIDNQKLTPSLNSLCLSLNKNFK